MRNTCPPARRIAVPVLGTAQTLTDRFSDMERNGRADDPSGWLFDAEASLLASFTRGLRAEVEDVAAALREPWSNGQTEGQINRLKTLKRQICDRAGIDLFPAKLVATP